MVRAVPVKLIDRGALAAAAIAALVLLAAGLARPAAAAVSCRAEVSRSTVARGEDVVLVVTAQGDIGWSPAFQLPDLPGVRVYGGGTNQSMTVVNGQTTTVVSRTYYLRVENEGEFTIGPVRVNTAAGTCETTPIAIKVVAGAAPPADTGNRVPRGGTARPAAGSEDVFVTMEVDRPQAWVGQQVVHPRIELHRAPHAEIQQREGLLDGTDEFGDGPGVEGDGFTQSRIPAATRVVQEALGDGL